jgi:hypothetical protein
MITSEPVGQNVEIVISNAVSQYDYFPFNSTTSFLIGKAQTSEKIVCKFSL